MPITGGRHGELDVTPLSRVGGAGGGYHASVRGTRYRDRAEAGARLADAVVERFPDLLADDPGRRDVVVLGLPRGGVPVAAVVADRLGAPLDVLVVRKLGLPGQPELAMGAIAGVGGVVEEVRNEQVLVHAHPSAEAYGAVLREERARLDERERAYRGHRRAEPVTERVVVVVDDGLATGSTMRAAVAALRKHEPAQIVVAAPIGARATCAELEVEVDAVVCPWTPEPFRAVGQGYVDFDATPDEEVIRLLSR
jgi:predicted phosphoribosyltransferase